MDAVHAKVPMFTSRIYGQRPLTCGAVMAGVWQHGSPLLPFVLTYYAFVLSHAPAVRDEFPDPLPPCAAIWNARTPRTFL